MVEYNKTMIGVNCKLFLEMFVKTTILAVLQGGDVAVRQMGYVQKHNMF